MAQKVFPNGLPKSLKDEIKDSLNFLAETDMQMYGFVTKETKSAFKTQKQRLDSKKVLKALKNQKQKSGFKPCPNRSWHHLGTTCKVCGQKG